MLFSPNTILSYLHLLLTNVLTFLATLNQSTKEKTEDLGQENAAKLIKTHTAWPWQKFFYKPRVEEKIEQKNGNFTVFFVNLPDHAEVNIQTIVLRHSNLQ